MNGDPRLYAILEELNIQYDYLEHPPAPTIEVAKQYWSGHENGHCKNIFLRDHRGKQHYLIILHGDYQLNITNIEKMLKRGKLSFASEQRLLKYLQLTPGSVTPFGLINDTEHHVQVFIDHNLQKAGKLSFHPCINTASLRVDLHDFVRFLDFCGNPYSWLPLY